MKIIRIFKTADLTHVTIMELMYAQQKQDKSVVDYMGLIKDNVAKEFPKLADANRQNLAVSLFCQRLRDQDVARKTSIEPKLEVATALHIAASATAYGREQRYFQRYEPSRRRYPANVAVDDDQQVDADVEGDEGDADADYEDAD